MRLLRSQQIRTGAKPVPPNYKKLSPCDICHRQQACVGYICAVCGFRVGLMDLLQFHTPGLMSSLYGTKRCRCGERKWLFPCEVKGVARR